jgi:hypothetical protein
VLSFPQFREVWIVSGCVIVSVEISWLIFIWSFYRHRVSVHLLIKGVGILDHFDLMVFKCTILLNLKVKGIKRTIHHCLPCGFTAFEITI